MHRISHWLTRHAAALFFPAALILYDFSAYLTTDLIQPGILHVVRDFNADVALAPASVSLYMAGGMALQWLLGPLSDRIGRRPVLLTGALIFTLACLATLFTTSMTQFLIARFVQGTSICFIATVGYVTVQEAFEEKRSIRLMAVITSVVLVAPIVGPLSGAALRPFTASPPSRLLRPVRTGRSRAQPCHCRRESGGQTHTARPGPGAWRGRTGCR